MLSQCAVSERKSQTARAAVHLLGSLLDILSGVGKAVADLGGTAGLVGSADRAHSRLVVVDRTVSRTEKKLRAK